MAGLLHWLFRRRRAAAPVAELPSAPEPEPVAETESDSEISPARLDAALQRLRDEHPPAPEGQSGG